MNKRLTCPTHARTHPLYTKQTEVKRATPKTGGAHAGGLSKTISPTPSAQHQDPSPVPAQLEVSVSDSRSALSSQDTESLSTNEVGAPKQAVFGWDSPSSAASSAGQSTFTFGDDGFRESIHEDDVDIGASDSKASSQIIEEGDLGLGLAHDRPLFESDLNFEVQSHTSVSTQSGANSPAEQLGIEKVGCAARRAHWFHSTTTETLPLNRNGSLPRLGSRFRVTFRAPAASFPRLGTCRRTT